LASTCWKTLERDVAHLIGGRRHWANAGGTVDWESDRFTVQCKLLRTCSLETLTQLVEQAEADGQRTGKLGLVAIKRRRGRGQPSPTLLVMTDRTFAAALGADRG